MFQMDKAQDVPTALPGFAFAVTKVRSKCIADPFRLEVIFSTLAELQPISPLCQEFAPRMANIRSSLLTTLPAFAKVPSASAM